MVSYTSKLSLDIAVTYKETSSHITSLSGIPVNYLKFWLNYNQLGN